MRELNVPLPLIVVGGKDWQGPTGPALALFQGGDHPEVDTVWGVVMQATGQYWCVKNRFIRFPKNFTEGRNVVSE